MVTHVAASRRYCEGLNIKRDESAKWETTLLSSVRVSERPGSMGEFWDASGILRGP